jgi:hypothetical protein
MHVAEIIYPLNQCSLSKYSLADEHIYAINNETIRKNGPIALSVVMVVAKLIMPT